MSLKPAAIKTPEAPPAVAAAAKPKPVVISFALLKKDGRWHGLVLKTQGREVLSEMVLDSDEFKLIPQDAVDRASHELWTHGLDPFEEEA